MSQKSVENINIEKNKELFEYEMTEVLLNLKGEFATFSGKGTTFEDAAVTDEQLAIPSVEIPPVEITELHIDISQRRPDVSFQCPDAAGSVTLQIALPEPPPQVGAFHIESKPIIVPVPDCVLPKKDVEKTPPLVCVSAARDIVVPSIPEEWNYSVPEHSVAFTKLEVPNTQAFCWAPNKLENIQNKSIRFPEVKPQKVTLRRTDSGESLSAKPKLMMPVQPPKIGPLSIKRNPIKIAIPDCDSPVSGEISQELNPAAVPKQTIAVPMSSLPRIISIQKPSVTRDNIEVPQAQNREWKPKDAFDTSEISFSVRVPKSSFSQGSVTVPPVSLRVTDVEIPQTVLPRGYNSLGFQLHGKDFPKIAIATHQQIPSPPKIQQAVENKIKIPEVLAPIPFSMVPYSLGGKSFICEVPDLKAPDSTKPLSKVTVEKAFLNIPEMGIQRVSGAVKMQKRHQMRFLVKIPSLQLPTPPDIKI